MPGGTKRLQEDAGTWLLLCAGRVDVRYVLTDSHQ